MASGGPVAPVRLGDVPALDATDARLLQALGEDPRATVMALSQRLGLARNTVQARLARLESSGALAPFDHPVRPEALGYPLGAYATLAAGARSLARRGEALRPSTGGAGGAPPSGVAAPPAAGGA